MKSLRSPILFLALLVVAGGALVLLRSSVQGKAGNYQVRLDAQGAPRESIVSSIAKTEGLSRTGAEQLLEKSESKLGYKVFDRLNLPANAKVDFVNLEKGRDGNSRVKASTVDLASEVGRKRDMLAALTKPRSVPRGASSRGPRRCGSMRFTAIGHTQGSLDCSSLTLTNPGALGPVRDCTLGGLSQFPGERTTGDFRVLVVAIEFPNWTDQSPTGVEPHGADCDNPTWVGLGNPAWVDPHVEVTSAQAPATLRSNVAFRSSFYSLLLDPGNPYSLRNWLTQVSHGNARIQGESADIVPWIRDGVLQASSGHQLETGVNFWIPQPLNVPVGPHVCGSPTNLSVFTWGDLKSRGVGPRERYRLKSYDYYTHWHDLQPVSTSSTRYGCGNPSLTEGVDPYQLASVTLDSRGSETELANCQIDRPVPMDCDLNETIYHGGVSYAPLNQGQIYSEFTNLHFHSGMGLVRDVSQILVDKSILPEVPGQAVTTADFRNRYDLLVVVVPDQVDEPFTPMQISPLEAIPEYLGSSNAFERDRFSADDWGTPSTLGYPGAPSVSVPSLILPASVALTPTTVPAPTGSGLATAAHHLGHAFGFVDTLDFFGFQSAAVSPYTVMQNGIRLDPWHKIQAGWLSPFLVRQDRLNAQVPQMENNLTNPIVYKVPADLNNVNGPEYFLVENHQSTGADFFGDVTPAGIYIWHIDERFGPVNAPLITSNVAPIPDKYNFFLNPTMNIQDFGDGGVGWSAYSSSNRSGSLNGDEANYFMGLIQADGLRQLERGVIGMEGDPFPGSSGRTQLTQHGDVANGDEPTTRFNPTILSQPPTTDNLSLSRRFRSAGDTYVRFGGISESASTMMINIFTRPREILIEPTSLVFIERVRAITGAANDTLTVTFGVTGTDHAVNPAVPLTVIGSDGPGNGNGTGAGDINNYLLESGMGTPVDLQGAVIQYNRATRTATLSLAAGALKDVYKLTVRNLNYQQSSTDSTGLPFGIENMSQGIVNDVVGATAIVKQGQTNVPIFKLHFRHTTQAQDIVASEGNVTINEFRIDEAGSSKDDTDIKRAVLYEDSNGDGLLNASPTPSGDRAIAIGSISNQSVTFTNLQYEIPLGETRDWFVTYDISDTAQTNPSITVGARVDNSAYFSQLVPGAVRERNYANGNFLFPWGSLPATIIEGADTLTVSPTSLAPATIAQGAEDVAMEALRFTVNRDDAVIKRIRVRQPDSALVTEVGRVKLWDDVDADGAFDPTVDTVLKEGILSASGGVKSVVFDDLNYKVVSGTARRVFITYSITTVAREGETASVRILNSPTANPPDIDVELVNNLNDPVTDIVSTASFPIQSATSTIVRATHSLTVTGRDLALPQIDPGRTTVVGGTPPVVTAKGVAMLKLIMTPEEGNISVRSIKVTKTGTADPTTVSLVRIYEDKNNNDELDSDDLETGGGALGTGTLDGSGVVTIALPSTGGVPTFTITEGSSRSVIVVYDIATTAPVGETVGASIQVTSDVDASPDAADFPTVPLLSTESQLRGFLDVTKNPTVYAPASLLPGDTDKVMLAFRMQDVRNPNDTFPATDPQVDPVTVTYLRVDIAGTAPAGTVTDVSIYEDLDADGVVDAGEVALPAGTPGSGYVEFSGLTIDVPVGVTKQFLVVFDIDGAALPGGTVSARMANTGYVVGDGVVVTPNFPLESDSDSVAVGNQTTPIIDAPPQVVCDSTFVRENGFTVAFSEDLDRVSAETEINYTLAVNSVVVSRTGWTATMRTDNRTVDVDIAIPPGTILSLGDPYTLTVNNIRDASGILGAVNGECLGTVRDSTPPLLTSCSADNENVRMKFTSADGLNESTAIDKANYALESPVGTAVDVSGATISVDAPAAPDPTVTITGLALATGATFEVTVSNVTDNAGNPVAAGSVCPGTVVDTLPPRVEACLADETRVAITFSEDVVEADALDKNNYDLQSPVGTVLNLSQVSLSYSSAARTVLMSNLSLTPTRDFKVTVRNVRDQSNNPMDKTGIPPRNTCTGIVGISLTIPGGSNIISLFSIPWNLTDKSALNLFQNQPGLDSDPVTHNWNIARWDPTGLDASRGRYVYLFEDPENRGSFVRINLGEAYFGTFPADTSVNVSEGSPLGDTTPLDVALPTNNWFILGNPYLFNFRWDTDQILVVRGGSSVTMKSLVGNPSRPMEYYAWAFDNATQDYKLVGDIDTFGSSVNDILEYASGAWVKTNTSGVTLRLPAPGSASRASVAAPQSAIRNPQSATGWSVELIASLGQRKDAGNLFGVNESLFGEGLLITAPPAAPKGVDPYGVELSFVRPERPRDTGGYEIDLRTRATANETWHFDIITSARNQEISLQWPNLTSLPKQYRLRLIDTQTGTRRAMRTTSNYTFRSNTDGDTRRRFQVELVPASQGGIRISNVSIGSPNSRSATSGVRVSCAVSHDAALRARILTASGRIIQVLGPVSVKAGINLLSWDMKNRLGALVPRGVYVIELVVEDEEGQAFKAVRTVRVQ